MSDPESGRTIEVRVLPDVAAMAQAAAGIVARDARESVDRSGRFLVALSGGATPVTLYRLLSTPAYDDLVPWRSTHVLWGDERCVAATDERSNYRLAADAGLLGRPFAGVHRMPGELSPEDGARSYEETLRRLGSDGTAGASGGPAGGAGSGPAQPGPPTLDLVLLGLGEDGHTASLFPGSPALSAAGRWVVAVEPHAGTARLSLSLELLTAARHALFMVAGAAKAAAVAEILGDHGSALPGARVLRGARRATLLLDEPASAGAPDRGAAGTRS